MKGSVGTCHHDVELYEKQKNVFLRWREKKITLEKMLKYDDPGHHGIGLLAMATGPYLNTINEMKAYIKYLSEIPTAPTFIRWDPKKMVPAAGKPNYEAAFEKFTKWACTGEIWKKVYPKKSDIMKIDEVFSAWDKNGGMSALGILLGAYAWQSHISSPIWKAILASDVLSGVVVEQLICQNTVTTAKTVRSNARLVMSRLEKMLKNNIQPGKDLTGRERLLIGATQVANVHEGYEKTESIFLKYPEKAASAISMLYAYSSWSLDQDRHFSHRSWNGAGTSLLRRKLIQKTSIIEVLNDIYSENCDENAGRIACICGILATHDEIIRFMRAAIQIMFPFRYALLHEIIVGIMDGISLSAMPGPELQNDEAYIIPSNPIPWLAVGKPEKIGGDLSRYRLLEYDNGKSTYVALYVVRRACDPESQIELPFTNRLAFRTKLPPLLVRENLKRDI